MTTYTQSTDKYEIVFLRTLDVDCVFECGPMISLRWNTYSVPLLLCLLKLLILLITFIILPICFMNTVNHKEEKRTTQKHK